MARFGEYNADGSVKTEADECILTGRKLAAPYDTTVRERVSGTPYFYRILGSQYHRVTDEMRAGWAEEAKPQKAVYVAPARKQTAKEGEAVE